jgi:hypothetical protein
MPTEAQVPFIISGKILHKESGSGIADLLVELFDLDKWSDPEDPKNPSEVAADPAAVIDANDVPSLYKVAERVASEITDASGQFTFQVTTKDFNLPRKTEQKPDLVLLVLAPDEPGLTLNQRLLHFAKDVRLNAGSREAYIIRLPNALLEKKEIFVSQNEEDDRQTTRSKVASYVSEASREQEFDDGVAAFHAVQAAKESQELKLFRGEFIKKVGTDLSAVQLPGVIAADGDDIRKKNEQVVISGITKANNALGGVRAQGVPVNLYFTPGDMLRLNPFFENVNEDFVEIPDDEIQDLLFRTNSSENPGTLLIHNNPISTYCAVDTEEGKCAKLHTELLDEPVTVTPQNPAAPSNGTFTNATVLDRIDRLVKHMPSPDLVLRPELAETRADRAEIEKVVNEFSLQKGPAEVPAFYDFNSLQIAFDHVWKQLFDETIPQLAFRANTLGKAHFGFYSVVNDSLKNGNLVPNAHKAVSPVNVPAVVNRFFDITKDEYNELSPGRRNTVVKIATSISKRSIARSAGTPLGQRMIQSLTEQVERLIESVRHDNYYSLHKTLRDLHHRLNSKYEFTVFAADKDHHSVNFGLMNTYRQQWTPLTYQAGRLVETCALSPKEERKYSVKTTRNEKRSSKEAKKNNSSITNEQHSTSKVEAEIMAKAQNKTTFGLSAEGDYDIGISSGKSTTTFGVEAINESAQNRKDFREAVLKAVQDYKEETSMEVTTDVDSASEYNESGTIVNPNDELAVTYLFYELQKRYRVSEQLYRVMPVILVAQEVPSPDQITPAWIISHDWILNRHLLDDSFRPTLRYIANNSVGDDFCLRELRRNLRQQRNLVETLKIEFASATRDAENKYAALLDKIDKRIKEQEDAADEGFFTNVGAFFGHDDADPDSARARELAASDEHKYAVDKAEHVAVALCQEVNTLHTLTDNYNKMLQARLDNETKVDRLLVHIRNNIFYYMQAIWNLEPPDQRYLRLHKVRVPVLELESRSYAVAVEPSKDIFAEFREPGTEKHKAFLHGTLKQNATGNFDTKSLVELADLDTVLGFKGNYIIFPMKEHNALTEFMAAPYIDSAFGAMDPDELSNVNLDEYSKYVCCLHDTLTPAKFAEMKEELREWLAKLLATPLRNGDEIVVPTGSLFIEALVDQKPILEDFKLKHREVDVFKVLEEVRRAGLENLRFAARLLNEEREDPDIEKKIVVTGNGVSSNIDVDSL